ncbi:MAG: DegT/DnrJ/EryC1/StrS family aminotransferase [candidate division Zixibacteria bacterium]|nr:DegT/DnrJ/EryC1/StrS family aminotransferase [Candidatus Tariuqbacter arcticus]
MEYEVRFIDYPKQYKKIRKEILETIDTVLSRGDVMMRRQMRHFENNLAAFVGTKYAVGTSNCTDAMHLTLRAAGIGAGDEVITVSHTFIATAAAIHHAGAAPVLVDIGEDHNMNVDLLEAAITPQTKAIIPVNLNGRLCDMEKVLAIAEKHGLIVIEDTAQSLGGSFKDIKGGNWGLAGCFSFYPAKLLGAYGDAGAMVTSSEEIAQKVCALRDHGRMPNGDIAGWSFNCRLDNLHAAILDLKLKNLPESLERRREIAKIYDDGLSGLSQLQLPPAPSDDGDYYDVFQNYEIEADDRDSLVDDLRKNGIEIMLPWGGAGVHQFKALGLTHFRLPRTEKLLSRALLLPMHPELEDEQAEYVVEVIKRHYHN